VYQRLDDFENAVKAYEFYEFAIRLDQKYVEYYRDLAGVYLREGYTKQAIDTVKRAKEWAPGKPSVVLALGHAYSAGEHYSAAVKEYKELLEKAPDMEAAREQLAKSCGQKSARRKRGRFCWSPLRRLISRTRADSEILVSERVPPLRDGKRRHPSGPNEDLGVAKRQGVPPRSG